MIPGTSLLVRIEHMGTDLGVDIDAFDLDKPRLPSEKTVPAMVRVRDSVSTVSLI